MRRGTSVHMVRTGHSRGVAPGTHTQETMMITQEATALRLGAEAPNFIADSTEGPLSFHEWLGDDWGVLFSHPKDFTPVCTTELGYMAKIQPEFERRGVKIVGLSVDATSNHAAWAD